MKSTQTIIDTVKNNKFRWAVRALFLVGFTIIIWGADHLPSLHRLVPACSPFLTLMALVTCGCSLLLLPAALILLVVIFKKRFFCRWVCPAGSCFEAVGSQFTKRVWVAKVPPLGLWFLFIGLGAAVMGFPLFIVLDPLAIFSGTFGWVRHDLTQWEKIGAMVFPAMVLMAAAAPWLWCGRLCPLGALQDVVFSLFNWIKLRACTAVEVSDQTSQSFDRSRRIFMGLGIGVGYRLLLDPIRAGGGSRLIRPPATKGEAGFLALCARCGACARACPEQIIKSSGTEGGFAGLLAPKIDFKNGECSPSCIQCGQVCPSGAIPAFTVENKYERPMGVAVVDNQTCRLALHKECGVCLNVCQYQALDLEWDPVEMISTLVVDGGLCTGCGSCQYVCPVDPVAIVIKPL
ncbi:MAG: 4Fe-4S dicluster domain-containing protein [Kiritimatiellia bacterium]